MGPPLGMGTYYSENLCVLSVLTNPAIGPPGGFIPGMAPAPGMSAQQYQQPGRPGMPPHFQPPANVDFSAPTIRLGFGGPPPGPVPSSATSDRRERDFPPAEHRDGPRRSGVGAEREGMSAQRQAIRENMLMTAAPSQDEAARTIFVGGISGELSDVTIEKVLKSIGPVRRWLRATDADDKKCSFGFAEFEDIDSLEGAAELLKGVVISLPSSSTASETKVKSESSDSVIKTEPGIKLEDADIKSEGGDAEVPDGNQTVALTVIVDEKYEDHLDYYRNNHPEDPSVYPVRLEETRKRLAAVLEDIKNPVTSNGDEKHIADDQKPVVDDNGQIVNAHPGDGSLAVEDELADIPAELREMVAEEIKSFRERSNKRDLERLRREEEVELAERMRSGGGPRPGSVATPPPQTPTIPSGPRDRGVNGAPVGPRGYMGPSDYKSGVSFVNGNGASGAADGSAGMEDSDASDEELERRRRAKTDAELEKAFLDQERRWLNRERNRTAALESQRKRDDAIAADEQREKDIIARRLKEWDDDAEASRKVEEYYRDRGLWIKNRAHFRHREADLDARDREQEEDEKGRLLPREGVSDQASSMADNFLARQSLDPNSITDTSRPPQRPEPTRFKMSLNSKAAPSQPRRIVGDVEGLLENEEESQPSTVKRTLKPIAQDPSARPAANLTPEERDKAIRQLAADIPTDREGLWNWKIEWGCIDGTGIVEEKIRPFVERKIVEFLGVQEDQLVDQVERAVKAHRKPGDLVKDLAGALDDEAEGLVKKLWRMLVFFGESERRGLGAA